MKSTPSSIILEVACRLIIPVLIVFGVYVLVHGEYSPGGGFQAGVVLALAVILKRVMDPADTKKSYWTYKIIALAGMGPVIYMLTGLWSIPFGGNFLEYGLLPLPVHEAERHLYGILFIEVGVTVGVMATIISIFDSLGKVGDPDDRGNLL